MARQHHNKRSTPGSSVQPATGWHRQVLLGTAAFGVSLLYLAMNTGSELRPPAHQSEDAGLPQASEVVKIRVGRASPFTQESPTPAVAEEAGGPLLATLLARRVSAGDEGDEVGTQEAGNNIDRTVQELVAQGPSALPAIHDILLGKEDGDLAAYSSGTPAGQRALRLALFDALRQIGGSEATEMLVEQLQQTIDPLEVAVLARYLEDAAPGAYREAVLMAARESLKSAEQSLPGEQHHVVPLFELFLSTGGPEVVAELERHMGKWWSYALLAITGLPEGEGIPSLTAKAVDPSVPVQYKPRLLFRMLAQAAVQYPEAGAALLEQAQAGQIPERAWRGLGAALQGMHLQYPADQRQDTVAGPNVIRYEQTRVSSTWSVEQVQNQVALIDALLGATASPAAKDSLYRARERLVAGS